MTREEAINEIKSWDFLEGKEIEAIHTLIPELAESEDERIWEALYDFISDTLEDYLSDYGISKGEALAYLEKQKDLDKMIVVSPEVWDNAITDAYENGKRDGEKQKEQKPDTRDADDLQLLGFIYDLLNEIEWKDNWAMSKDECLRRLNNYRPQKPASISCGHENDKPAEWSEDIIQKAVKEVGLTQHQINWFKTNVFPPKQEWSEEGKRKLNRIYEIIGQAADEQPFGSSKRIIGDKEAVELQDFIKSLRPQPKVEWDTHDKAIVTCIACCLDGQFVSEAARKKCLEWFNKHRRDFLNSPSWKPSEEQMKALYDACCISFEEERDFHPSLSRLYHDLMKL